MRTLTPTCVLVSMLLASASAGQGVSGDALIDVRFRGGTATQYIATIREAAGDLNILVAPEAADVQKRLPFEPRAECARGAHDGVLEAQRPKLCP